MRLNLDAHGFTPLAVALRQKQYALVPLLQPLSDLRGLLPSSMGGGPEEEPCGPPTLKQLCVTVGGRATILYFLKSETLTL